MKKKSHFQAKIIRIGFIAVLCLVMLSSFINCPEAFADSKFQYWNTEGAEWNFHKDLKATVEGEFRFRTGGLGFYYQHTDVGLVYSGIGKWLDLGVNYRSIFFKAPGEGWLNGNNLHMNATLKHKLFGFDLSTRSRFEYRGIESADDRWRYRNKFTVKLPWKLTRFEIRPYIADEIFVDFYKKQLNRNRLYGGVSIKIWKHLKGNIFYLWQASRSKNNWNSQSIFGTKLKLVF